MWQLACRWVLKGLHATWHLLPSQLLLLWWLLFLVPGSASLLSDVAGIAIGLKSEHAALPPPTSF